MRYRAILRGTIGEGVPVAGEIPKPKEILTNSQAEVERWTEATMKGIKVGFVEVHETSERLLYWVTPNGREVVSGN